MTGPPDLLSMADIATMLGIQTKTVQNMRYTGQLPKEDRTVGRTPAWYPTTVREWATRTGRTITEGAAPAA